MVATYKIIREKTEINFWKTEKKDILEFEIENSKKFFSFLVTVTTDRIKHTTSFYLGLDTCGPRIYTGAGKNRDTLAKKWIANGLKQINCNSPTSIQLHTSDADEALKFVSVLNSEEPDENNIKKIIHLIEMSKVDKLLLAAQQCNLKLFNENFTSLPKELSAEEFAEIVDYEHGGNVLHWAAENGHLEMVKSLIQKFPKLINTITNNGSTAILNAVINNHFETAQYLYEQHANLSITNVNGKNVFDECANKKEGKLKDYFKQSPQDTYLQQSSVLIRFEQGITLSESNKKLVQKLINIPNITISTVPKTQEKKKPDVVFGTRMKGIGDSKQVETDQFFEKLKQTPKANELLNESVSVQPELQLVDKVTNFTGEFDQYPKSSSKIGEAPKEKTNQDINDEISALKNELLNYKPTKSKGSVGTSQQLTSYDDQKRPEIDFFTCDPMEQSGQFATGSSNVTSSFFTSKAMLTKSELDDFTQQVKDYLNTFKPELNIAKTLNSLNLTEEERELFGSFIDPIKVDWVEEMIVTVNENYYDFESLNSFEEQTDKMTGKRVKIDPLTREPFDLKSVQPGRLAYKEFNWALKQLANQRGYKDVKALLNDPEGMKRKENTL